MLISSYSIQKVLTSRPDLRRCYHASLFSLTQIHNIHIQLSIYSWLQLSIYNPFRLSLKNKKMVKLEHPVLCILFHLKPLKKAQSSQHHISFHLFQPNYLSKSLSSFQAEHYLISPWWLETTLQAQVLVAGPEKGSLLIYSHDISQIYYECVYAELQNCLCHLAIASLSDASRVYFKRKNSMKKRHEFAISKEKCHARMIYFVPSLIRPLIGRTLSHPDLTNIGRHRQ